jgi:hypothetical protein
MPAIDPVFHRLMMEAIAGDYRSIRLFMRPTREQIAEHEDWQIRFMDMVLKIEDASEEKYAPPDMQPRARATAGCGLPEPVPPTRTRTRWWLTKPPASYAPASR